MSRRPITVRPIAGPRAIDLARAPVWVVVVVAALGVGLAAQFGLLAEPAQPRFVSALQQVESHSGDASDESRRASLPAAALAATLRDELFPEPVVAAAPAPIPELKIELIAISTSGDGSLRAFLYDGDAREYIDVSAGSTTPSGALIAAIEPGAVVIEAFGSTHRLELAS